MFTCSCKYIPAELAWCSSLWCPRCR